MKNNFIKEDFLLNSSLAKEFYFDYVSTLPIIDYHCHLPPDQIATNHKFESITEIWLNGDHYKWRAMRAIGVAEKYITGDAIDQEKFAKWAEVVPYTMRNPLYHWTHMELKNPFGIDKLLDPTSADSIYQDTKSLLKEDRFSTQGLLSHFKVEMVGTTDDPIDSLEHHRALNNSDFETKILPSFRPDKAFNIDGGDFFREYIQRLSTVSNIQILDLDSLLEALFNRIEYFHALGCRIADHGLGCLPFETNIALESINITFKSILAGENIHIVSEMKDAFVFYVLTNLSKKYNEKNWSQQFHLGAFRNTNTRSKIQLGPDTGFDTIGDYQHGERLWKFLDFLQKTDQLPRTIIYNLNPSDNALFGSMIGNFQQEGIKGKIQFGSAWWFLDQLDGMKDQIDTLSNLGLLSCFVGMLTDSRSFLSYSRHEYFRRLLCEIFADDVLKGKLPNDKGWIGKILQDICYYNAKDYFNISS
ncbi:MAG: glucuronate isomerase [Sphingobacterium composti]